MSKTKAARRLRRAALAVILVGAIASAGAYVFGRRSADPPEFGTGSIAETRELQQLERLGGKASVQILRFQQWFESLWHGERLAATLAVLAVLVAALCWHLASLADEDDGADAQ